MHLFAFQDAPAAEFPPPWIFAAAIVSISLIFVLVFVGMILRQAARNREFVHLERMKALEQGQRLEPTETENIQSKYLHNIFWIAFWIGAVVPTAATSAASSIMIQTNLNEFRIILAIWICVAVIAVASVSSATSLMISTKNWWRKAPPDEKRESV